MQNVETVAGEFIDVEIEVVQEDYAPSIVADYEAIKDLLANAPAPKRPNRSIPLEQDNELAEELEAWGRVSAEASEDNGWE
jgi:hypothetical protein